MALGDTPNKISQQGLRGLSQAVPEGDLNRLFLPGLSSHQAGASCLSDDMRVGRLPGRGQPLAGWAGACARRQGLLFFSGGQAGVAVETLREAAASPLGM